MYVFYVGSNTKFNVTFSEFENIIRNHIIIYIGKSQIQNTTHNLPNDKITQIN